MIEGRLEEPVQEGLGFVHPSTLAQGCFLAVARELLGHPKAEPGVRRLRLMQAGNAAHERVMNYVRPFLVAQEVPFLDPEHRIKGRCDGLLFIPKTLSPNDAGFYVLEVKAVSSTSFLELKATGTPRIEHVRQCQIYQWGLANSYELRIQGGLIYYENRDTLEYALFLAPSMDQGFSELLEKLRFVVGLAKEGRLPEGPEYKLPEGHWAHRYCPYLHLCGYGQGVVAQNKGHLSEALRAKIIAQSIVKKAHKKEGRKQKSLEELAEEFGWE
ncbi:MAG: hypothetical protein ABDI20_08720 [Candidatus Bipolaricaulaceae bacterium]